MSVQDMGYRYITEGMGSVYLAHNQNLLVKYVLDKGVLDRDEDTPPGSPTDGDAYVVAATATGAWVGHEDHIAYWFDEIGVWKFISPDEGLHVYLADEDVQIKHLGGSSGWDVVAGSGTVTEVNGTGTVAGLTLTGSVTGAGDLTLGGTLLVDLTSMVTGVLPLANMTGTTVGKNVLNLTNPSAIRFLRLNADNTVDALSDSAFRTAIGVGAGSGTVTQVDGAGTVAGLTLTGSVTTTGSLTLGGTLAVPVANITASTSDPIGVGSVNLGHASDTTITRVSAGLIAVEGVNVVTTATNKPTETIIIACSDETTAVTTGTAKVTFRMPYAFTLSAVRSSVTTAPTGATLIVDINETGSTILSTKLSIDASEKTSTTAASAAVISDTSLADDAEITIDFDQVGSTIAGAGVKVYLIGSRT
jgi:hypothetical protein